MLPRTSFVVSRIAERVSDHRNRLFAIVYLNRRQFKISQHDIIHIHHNIPLDIGDKIKLEKVLMVGGKDFSIFGRPLLNPEHVQVNATVIEKTITSPEVNYVHIGGKQIHSLDWLSHELTALRINEITVDKAVLGNAS